MLDRPKEPFYYQLSMPNNFHNSLTVAIIRIIKLFQNFRVDIISLPCHTDLSPPDFKDAHYVLTLDLREFDSHSKCVQEVLNKYGKVSVLVCSVHVHVHE